MSVVALFVDPKGHYPRLLGPENCWDEERDARNYDGSASVVAHPPCHLWVNLAAVNWKRYRRERPAWYPGGSDGGCFSTALALVKTRGGVLEHPAYSHAWAEHRLPAPPRIHPRSPLTGLGWHSAGRSHLMPEMQYWVCEVWQSAPKYKHLCRKCTWLFYSGDQPPFELDWTRRSGTHQVGWFDRKKPTVGKRAASASPEAFARELIALAAHSRAASRVLAALESRRAARGAGA